MIIFSNKHCCYKQIIKPNHSNYVCYNETDASGKLLQMGLRMLRKNINCGPKKSSIGSRNTHSSCHPTLVFQLPHLRAVIGHAQTRKKPEMPRLECCFAELQTVWERLFSASPHLLSCRKISCCVCESEWQQAASSQTAAELWFTEINKLFLCCCSVALFPLWQGGSDSFPDWRPDTLPSLVTI